MSFIFPHTPHYKWQQHFLCEKFLCVCDEDEIKKKIKAQNKKEPYERRIKIIYLFYHPSNTQQK